MPRVIALSLIIILQLTQQALADSSATSGDNNLRLSIGRHTLMVDPAEAYASDLKQQHSGWSLGAEMPQSDHTASRALLYRVDEEGLQATGIEMQILWGYGLSAPGFRIYAGPGFFFEHRKDLRAATDRFDAFRDFALSAGTGYQYKRYVVDINYQRRDPRSYQRELKARSGKGSINAASLNLSFGYQF